MKNTNYDNLGIFLPYEVWIEFDEENNEENQYNFLNFDEAENCFKNLRLNTTSRVIFRERNFETNYCKIIATFHP
jgi:hypothetical protein